MVTGYLQDSAGLDPTQDRYYVGYIAAVKDLLLMEPDYEQESE